MRVRVSIAARLIPVIAFLVSALAGAIGSYHQIRSMSALRENEGAGVGAISGALSEANVLIIVLMSLSAVIGLGGLGVAVARLFATVRKATPPAYFFVPTTILGLLPATLFYTAQTIIINTMMQSLSTPGPGILGVADVIFYLHVASIVVAVVAFPILTAAAFIPFSSRVGKRLGSLFVLLCGVGTILLFIALLVYRNVVLHEIWRNLG